MLLLHIYVQRKCRFLATADEHNIETMMDRAVYDVFLGGSCGDTAWRRQVVIPHLRQLGLSYFDPQRNEWSEEMINEEAVAKEVRHVILDF